MSRRLIIIVGAIAVVVVVAALAAWLWPRATETTPPEQVPVAQPSPQPEPAPIPEPEPLATPAPTVAPDLEFAALTFAEVFGSYSSDEPRQNLAAAASLATSSFAAELKAQAASLQAPAAGTFYGVSTRALFAQVKAQTGSSAMVAVRVQREERFSRTGEVRVSYQDITLTLEQGGGGWLAAGAKWGK